MSSVRHAAVAGVFYPGDPEVLASTVDAHLDAVGRTPRTSPTPGAPPVALVVPHAGYVYSAPIAAHAFATLQPWRQAITRVVVIGPNHRVPLRGLALTSADEFETPLGRVPVDVMANGLLRRFRGVVVDDRPHRDEHCIEVQLPFLQRVLAPGWSLVPIVVGSVDGETVADALSTVWGSDGTLVVVSTDLSHYHSATVACRLDAATAARIVGREWQSIDGDDACGATPLCGALRLAERRGDTVELLDLRNSADTAGPADRVVGYDSFLVGVGG